MRNSLHLLKAVLFVASLFSFSGALAREEFEGWNLETSVARAHLVMVARVESISQVTFVEGAKTDIAMREFRFQPVEVLKGIFQRDQLSMTASDLGISPDDVRTDLPLKEGEYRLLILTQQQRSGTFGGIQSFGCVSAAPGANTFNERVPQVTELDDPLVGVVETLIQVVDSRSRRERARLLVDRLVNADNLAAVPLLSSLQSRADWAAGDERASAPLIRLAGSRLKAVRTAAIAVLRDMFASQVTLHDAQEVDAVADRLHEVLNSGDVNSSTRIAALESLGHLLRMRIDVAWARDFLIAQLTSASTYRERLAAATALSQIPKAENLAPLLDAFDHLPLDEVPAREAVYANALMRFLPEVKRRTPRGDIPAAERALLNRSERSIAAAQSLGAEVEPLGIMQSQESLPLLLTAAVQIGLAPADHLQIARALGRIGDDRAADRLAQWLGESNYQLKEVALSALESLDSQAAARAVRPLLRTEPRLEFKLRMARLLARHGYADGYQLAIEHLADAGRTAQAALVLAALDDPRTEQDLSAILTTRADRRWRAAALTGLAAVGDKDARVQLLEILSDDRDPLVVEAAGAAGLTADSEFLLPLARLAKSRNRQIARASLMALRRFLTGVRSSPRGLAAVEPEALEADDGKSFSPAAEVSVDTRATIAENVATLAADPYVEPEVRDSALAVAWILGGDRYPGLLTDLEDRSDLEGTALLKWVQAEQQRLREPDTQL